MQPVSLVIAFRERTLKKLNVYIIEHFVHNSSWHVDTLRFKHGSTFNGVDVKPLVWLNTLYKISSLQTNHVYSTFKRRGNSHFNVEYMWCICRVTGVTTSGSWFSSHPCCLKKCDTIMEPVQDLLFKNLSTRSFSGSDERI